MNNEATLLPFQTPQGEAEIIWSMPSSIYIIPFSPEYRLPTFMVYRGHTAFHAELGKKWCPFPKTFPVIFRENRLWLVPYPTKDSHPCIDSDGGAIPRGTVNLQASPRIRKKCRHQWLEGPITSHATPSLTTRMMLTGSQLQMIMRKGRFSSLKSFNSRAWPENQS